MKNLLIIALLLSPYALADDFKSNIRFQEGDVISADVFNDMLDEFESRLTTVQSSDLIGSWDIVQTLPALDNWTPPGVSAPIDDIYVQRADTVVISDDGDGTYSLQTENYCSFRQLSFSEEENNPCVLNFAIVDGRFLLRYFDAGLNKNWDLAYVAEKVSNTRIILSSASGSVGGYNIIRLDKNNVPPAPPTRLSASNIDGLITLSWTAGDSNTISYKIMSRDSNNRQFTELASGLGSTTYSDSVNSGIKKWYRVFAVNADGESIGSNVVKVTVE